MAWAGSVIAPGPFNFRGCDLTAECLPATEDVRVQFPATAPISLSKPRTSLRSRVSKTQLAWGSTRAACQFLFYGAVVSGSVNIREDGHFEIPRGKASGAYEAAAGGVSGWSFILKLLPSMTTVSAW